MIYLFTFLISFCFTLFIRGYALKKGIIDNPNERSSHTVPTPRGGGIAIVLAFLVSSVVVLLNEELPFIEGSALIITSLLIAIIGFIDDHNHVSARWRLLVHIVMAMSITFLLGAVNSFTLFNSEIEMGVIAIPFTVLAIVWLLNLFNFMDGIDGIAGVEVFTCCLVMGVFTHWFYPGEYIFKINLLLAFSSLGFLVWNLPPAKIFMGDAGSGFIGFTIGSIILISYHTEQALMWAWLIMLGVFIVDATLTLFMRILSGKKVYDAHRNHAYQYASRIHKSHKKVTISVAIINLIWLAPISFLVLSSNLNGLLGLLIGYSPIVFLAYKYKAGCNNDEAKSIS